MNLNEWLSSLNFSISPTLDGELHRCDRAGTKKDDNVWYQGSVNLSPTGKEWTSLTIGDWTTGEKHTFPPRNGVVWSDDEKRYYEVQHKKQKENADKERAIRQEEAAKEAERIWNEAGIFPPDHPYLVKKGLYDKAEELLPYIKRSGECLIVPMRDFSGKLWGIQRIFANGEKRFLKGQRTQGLCLELGDRPSMDVFIVEGFATGVSVFLASRTKVYVAFNAGNLESVARSVCDRYRSAPEVNHRIVICGDADETGRKKAMAAAEVSGAEVVFPDFSRWSK